MTMETETPKWVQVAALVAFGHSIQTLILAHIP
jgi:hypothetical protein